MSKIQIQLKDGRNINLELYEEIAPITVRNFKNLIAEKYFDGLCFHRTINGFMIQGGGFYQDGHALREKHGAKTIKGEFSLNGVKNNLHHGEGVISMARTNIPDSASSQFFICFEPANYLDGDYAAFGKVVYGMDEVDTMAEVATDANDKPLTPVVMKKMTIITDDEYKNMPK